MRNSLFVIASVVIMTPFCVWAGGGNIKGAIDELYNGRRPVSDFSLQYTTTNVVSGDIVLDIGGTGQATAKKICAGTSCTSSSSNCTSQKPRSKSLSHAELMNLIRLIRDGGILDMPVEYPPMLCDRQYTLTISIKGSGSFSTQIGERYLSQQAGFSKLVVELKKIIDSLLND